MVLLSYFLRYLFVSESFISYLLLIRKRYAFVSNLTLISRFIDL